MPVLGARNSDRIQCFPQVLLTGAFVTSLEGMKSLGEAKEGLR